LDTALCQRGRRSRPIFHIDPATEKHRSFSLLKTAHKSLVFNRRTRVLAEFLAAKIPVGSSVLDIGCGDGTVASLIAEQVSGVNIVGAEFAPRPTCLIECKQFDGIHLPFPDASFDVCMFVDVLHHTHGIQQLISEACRVTRRFVLIKDHLAENRFDFLTLKMMDWVGNRPHGVVLPYNYQSREQWNTFFSSTGLIVRSWQNQVPLYPFPFSGVFGRKLHVIALLEKTARS
jgi:SAM-dependent methyltransferase